MSEGFFDADWKNHWTGMPEFVQEDQSAIDSINVQFATVEDREAFMKMMGYGRDRTMSIWWPRRDALAQTDRDAPEFDAGPTKHPVYVISKGRWESRMTHKALERLRIPHRMVIEPQEQKKYAKVIDPEKLLVLPFSNLGQGSIPARNWVWEHSIEQGAEWHWILDDNIHAFYRLNRNTKHVIKDENPLVPVERFVDKWENVAIAGLNYEMFAPRRSKLPPYYLNTRIYSCILIRNDIPYRWRGRYNEDTDLSLRALKDGWCTVLFNAYLAKKMTTMLMKGGNTDELYKTDGEQGIDGRRLMAESLQKQHPDVVTVTRKWGRWQHQVDYKRFKRNRLKPKKQGKGKKS